MFDKFSIFWAAYAATQVLQHEVLFHDILLYSWQSFTVRRTKDQYITFLICQDLIISRSSHHYPLKYILIQASNLESKDDMSFMRGSDQTNLQVQ